EILSAHGYHTAGLVNDAQMKTTWSCNRGFRQWVEFPALTPAGKCDHITDEALQWLAAQRVEPFFLFLHYYDPHNPYEPPEPFRGRFGATLSGAETDALIQRFHYPWLPFRDSDLLQQLIGCYDGAIAWLDQELGRLLAALPENTLVIVFSDHGEAFKEHGRLTHGATLYEEELHVALLMSMPEVLPEGRPVDEPVMLLDVAPTILGVCGV